MNGDCTMMNFDPVSGIWIVLFVECAKVLYISIGLFLIKGKITDRADPYGFFCEKRPQSASISQTYMISVE
jgi:hypothetical protein